NDLAHRPKSFALPEGKAVFADFTKAHYEITYDLGASSAWVKARIEMHLPEAGRVVFDSIEAPVSIMLNGKKNVSAREVKTPSNDTTVRVLGESLNKGKHVLELELPLKNLVEFKDGGVKSGFWTSDLSHRQFLERYLPANFEYDQVKMSFLV